MPDERQDAALVVFVADPDTAIHVRAHLHGSTSVRARHGLSVEGLRGVYDYPLLRAEVIDAGMLARSGPDRAASVSGQSRSDNTAKPWMCRHRIDVALSRGRHSAERAKLAGHGRLICAGLDIIDAICEPRSTGTTDRIASQRGRVQLDAPTAWTQGAQRNRQAAYTALLEQGNFAVAAMVGAIIACAQMGITVHTHGATGALAATFAKRLRPDALEWLDCRDTHAEAQTLAPNQASDTHNHHKSAAISHLDMVEYSLTTET